jgi:AcrR family transcriptional regulator
MGAILNPSTDNMRGLRERNKEDKLRSIRNAARHQFIKKGYESTTTREIAMRANVGIGTLFAYASDKRDILFLTINDQTEEAVRTARSRVAKHANLIDGLLIIFRPLYELMTSDPALFRVALKEFNFSCAATIGAHTQRFEEIRQTLIETIAVFLKIIQSMKKQKFSETVEFVATTIFFLYQGEVRIWLSGDTIDVDEGLTSLRRRLSFMFEMQTTALKNEANTSTSTSSNTKVKRSTQRTLTKHPR